MDLANIDCLGIDRVLQRGTGEIIERRSDALLVRDQVSGAYFLAFDDAGAGASLLDRHADRGYDLLMVPDLDLGRWAFRRYGFAEGLECFQAAYYGEPPVPGADLTVRTAEKGDLPLLVRSYQLVSPEELEKIVERRSLLLGYDGERPVGFIGEHLEGSMGLLYVFPEFRRRGFAAALERIWIAKTMERGFIPFGQVEKDNPASLALQKKLGMTLSDNLICWMWR